MQEDTIAENSQTAANNGPGGGANGTINQAVDGDENFAGANGIPSNGIRVAQVQGADGLIPGLDEDVL